MWLDKLPKPLQTLVRRIVLRIRIPLHQMLSFYHHWYRKWLRHKHADPRIWKTVDFSTHPKSRNFCISLLEESRFDTRRQLFKRQAKRYGWDVEFWPAVHGSRFRNEPFPEWIEERNKPEPRPFTAGAVGLLCTTLGLYEWAQEQDLDYCVIFEDDAVIHGSPKLEVPDQFDIVFLNNRIKGDSFGRVRHGWGGDGYIISRTGIQKMLEIFEHVNADIDMLFMMYTKSLAERGHYMTKHRDSSKEQLECFQVGPIVTHAGFFDSTIGLVSKETLDS